MSALPQVFPFNSGLAGLHLSADQFLAIGETLERYEVARGVVMPMSRPTMRHQALSLQLLEQLLEYRRTSTAVIFHEIDWRLDDQTVYSPDIICFRPGRSPTLGTYLREIPDLVIEILSPGNKAFDFTEKKDDYERAGVAEYWAIDPPDTRVWCYQRAKERLFEIPVFGDSLASTSLPGFTLDIRPLRALAGTE